MTVNKASRNRLTMSSPCRDSTASNEDFLYEIQQPTAIRLKANLRKMMEDSSTLIVAIPSVCIVLSYLGTYVAKYPLFVVDYGSDEFFGIGLKDWFSYAFTIGFFLGKFPSYTLVPSITRDQRLLVLFLLFAVTSLFNTGFLPLQGPYSAPIQILAVLIGSINCSAIFGVEFGYIEGRSRGDIFIAALNCVVLFGSSLCRAAGASLIQAGVSGRWMPLLAVSVYTPITILSLICLDATPDPNEADMASRGERTSMTAVEKKTFLRLHGIGLFPLLFGYAFCGGFRFLRDFYALEIYRDVLKREPEPLDYILADWVGGALSVLSLLAMSCIADNTCALMVLHGMFVGGGLLMGVGTFLFQRGWISPELWIIAVGVGVSISVTPFTGSFFDRVVACTRTKGTAVFLVFFADGIAYIGVLILLLYKTTRSSDTSYSDLFLTGSYAFTGILITTGALSAKYWSLVAKKVQDGAYNSLEVYGAVDSETDSVVVPSQSKIEMEHLEEPDGLVRHNEMEPSCPRKHTII